MSLPNNLITIRIIMIILSIYIALKADTFLYFNVVPIFAQKVLVLEHMSEYSI